MTGTLPVRQRSWPRRVPGSPMPTAGRSCSTATIRCMTASWPAGPRSTKGSSRRRGAGGRPIWRGVRPTDPAGTLLLEAPPPGGAGRTMPTIKASTLHELVLTIARAMGSREEEARDVADHLVAANLAGHDSHGVG